MGIFEINKDLLPMKAHYFLWNAGTAPVTPFLSVYAKQLGFSSFIVGIIYTILPICGMLAKPLMGAVADKYKCQKKIFLSFEVLTAMAFMAILYMPENKLVAKSHFACDYSESVFDTCLGNMTSVNKDFIESKIKYLPNVTAYCELNCPLQDKEWYTVKSHWNYTNQSGPDLKFTAHVPLYLADSMTYDCVIFKINNITLPNGKTVHPVCPSRENLISSICDIKCDSEFINEFLPRRNFEDDEIVGTYHFWLFITLMILGWIGQAVVVSVSDTICFDLLGNQPNKYGNQRCFGSLGWGVFAIITGLIVDWTSEREDYKNYTYAFHLSFLMLVLDIFISFRLKTEQRNVSVNILKDVGSLLSSIRVCIFMLWCIFIGMCTGLLWNFLFWLIEDDLGGNTDSWIKTLEGLVMSIQCLGGELPLFFLSGWIVRKIGHVNCMTFILLAMGLRFILYSILTDPWWILPIEFFNGITFGLFYACMASYASIIAPPGTETTMQGLVGAVFEGIGASTGAFVGGYMFEAYSGLITFRIFGIVSLVLCLLHFAAQCYIRRASKDLVLYRPPSDLFEPFDYEEQSQELKLV